MHIPILFTLSLFAASCAEQEPVPKAYDWTKSQNLNEEEGVIDPQDNNDADAEGVPQDETKSSTESEETDEPNNPDSQQPSGGTDDLEPEPVPDGDPANPQDPNEPGDEPEEDPDQPGDGPEAPEDVTDGEAVFTDTVLPAFQANNCNLCHADPRQDPPVQGPLSIFNYQAMLTLMDTNTLFDKVQNILTHGGGDQCQGIENSPCVELLTWWDAEFGSDPAKAADRPIKLLGEVRKVSDTGTITGWGYDPDLPAEAIAINVYFDGDNSTGTLIVDGTANLAGFDNNLDGNHAFQLSIPEASVDNLPHSVSVYGIIGGEEVELKGSPYNFTAFAKNPDGEAYYNATVSGVLGACPACHTFNYDTHWASLLTPSPANGGTADNNALFNKMSGAVQHAGGVFCGGGNGNPCTQLREWWTIEFGQ